MGPSIKRSQREVPTVDITIYAVLKVINQDLCTPKLTPRASKSHLDFSGVCTLLSTVVPLHLTQQSTAQNPCLRPGNPLCSQKQTIRMFSKLSTMLSVWMPCKLALFCFFRYTPLSV